MPAAALHGINCNYADKEIELSGSPRALKNLANLLRIGERQRLLSLPDNRSNKIYVSPINAVELLATDGRVHISAQGMMLKVEGAFRHLIMLSENIRGLADDGTPSDVSLHRHIDSASMFDWIDPDTWPLIIVKEG